MITPDGKENIRRARAFAELSVPTSTELAAFINSHHTPGQADVTTENAWGAAFGYGQGTIANLLDIITRLESQNEFLTDRVNQLAADLEAMESGSSEL